jgi:RecA-family ATPase
MNLHFRDSAVAVEPYAPASSSRPSGRSAWHAYSKDKGGRPILVVIDVLAKVRKPTGNKQLYEADYEALAGLTQMAGELGLAVVVVHHTRKMASDGKLR